MIDFLKINYWLKNLLKMNKFSVKVKHETSVKRFQVDSSSTFEQFQLYVYSLFEINVRKQFSYQDDENDLVLLNSEQEWKEAKELCIIKKLEYLRITLKNIQFPKNYSRLSSPFHSIKDYYEIIVIGSGYGGGISASRLSRAGKKVCLLEKGREIWPGEYPEDLSNLLIDTQIDRPTGRIGVKTAMLDVRMNDEMHVWVGCGLGGTSLVNANVTVIPDPKVFDQFPLEIRENFDLMQRGYKLTSEWLQTTPIPDEIELQKSFANKRSAQTTRGKWFRPPLAISLNEKTSMGGIKMKPCIYCGNCVTGCNQGSKQTTLMNYLPDAKRHGCEIYCHIEVLYIEKKDEIYILHCHNLVENVKFTIKCGMCIVSAGSLGSTEILLRSKKNGLETSDLVGTRFTGNGDVIGFAYNGEKEVRSVGYSTKEPIREKPVGPTITSINDLRKQSLKDSYFIAEGAFPNAIQSILASTFSYYALTSQARRVPTDNEGVLRRVYRELQSNVQGPRVGSVNNTQMFLFMGHDDSNGKMILKDDRLRIEWKNVHQQEVYQKSTDILYECTISDTGIFIKNPITSESWNNQLITVHPLGGLPMGKDALKGAVNHLGQVFQKDEKVYENLLVLDGSIFPCSIGVNPFYTICALVERNIFLLAEKKKWKINYENIKDIETLY